MQRIVTHPGCKRRRAFSLVELVIVVVIIGTLTAVAMPRFAEARMRYKSQLTARQLAGELEKARAYARAQSRTVTVLVAPSSDRLVIKAGDSLILTDLSLSARDNAEIHSAAFRTSTAFEFDGFGTPSAGGSITVRCGSWYSTVAVGEESGEITFTQTASTSP